jgi:predicted RNA-binding protein YlqC (UPF0109 family)
VVVKELIEYIARNLVDDPEQVEVTQIRRGPEIVFKLHVAKEDMGRVIGKQGRIANSIRALVNVSAARNGKTVELDIEDPR